MISYLAMTMLQRSPLLLVILGGIVFSLVRWRRHPRISGLTLFGLVLYLIKLFGFSALSYAIPRMRESMQWSYRDALNMYLVLDVVNSLVLAAIIILLVVVAFFQRTAKNAPGTGAVNRY